MIFLTRLNHVSFVVNSDLIEHIEVTPDTVIALTTGEKIRVRESAQEVIDLTVRFRRSILAGFPPEVSPNSRGFLSRDDSSISPGLNTQDLQPLCRLAKHGQVNE